MSGPSPPRGRLRRRASSPSASPRPTSRGSSRTVRDLGYARDEGFYFQAARRYARWFEQLLASTGTPPSIARAVDAAWSVNHEHPALMKSLFALSSLFLREEAPPLRHGGHELPLPGDGARGPRGRRSSTSGARGARARRRARGRGAARGDAALLLPRAPRVLRRAHRRRCGRWPRTSTGARCATAASSCRSSRACAFGLALDTKHNAWFLPIACAAHFVALQALGGARRTRDSRRAGEAALARPIPRPPRGARGARGDGPARAAGVLRALAVDLARHGAAGCASTRSST